MECLTSVSAGFAQVEWLAGIRLSVVVGTLAVLGQVTTWETLDLGVCLLWVTDVHWSLSGCSELPLGVSGGLPWSTEPLVVKDY